MVGTVPEDDGEAPHVGLGGAGNQRGMDSCCLGARHLAQKALHVRVVEEDVLILGIELDVRDHGPELHRPDLRALPRLPNHARDFLRRQILLAAARREVFRDRAAARSGTASGDAGGGAVRGRMFGNPGLEPGILPRRIRPQLLMLQQPSVGECQGLAAGGGAGCWEEPKKDTYRAQEEQ